MLKNRLSGPTDKSIPMLVVLAIPNVSLHRRIAMHAIPEVRIRGW